MEVNAKNAGLAGGILWGIVMLLSTLISLWTGWAGSFLVVMSSVYPGYAVTYVGAVVGALYGFLDAFVGLFLLAWIYNKLESRP
jgi:hypothetical protein